MDKFVIGIPIAAAVFETIIKLLIELYGDDKIKRKIKRATLGRTLKVFEKRCYAAPPTASTARYQRNQ